MTKFQIAVAGCVCATLALLRGSSAGAQGPGDLTVTPTRVIFEGRTRTAQISVINRGAKTATYRIAFFQMRMDEDGQLEEIETPGAGEQFADPFLRFSPREVTLEPELAQTVRLLLRKPAGLPPGEYRSHLLLYAIPAQEDAKSENLEIQDKKIGIRLIPVYRVSIPVIVREGELEATARLADLAVQPGSGAAVPSLSFRLVRGGERSLYGDVTISYVPADGGSARVVGEIKGLAVYTPNEARRVQVPLYLPPGLELKKGDLKVSFTESQEGRAAAPVEASIPLP